MLFIAIDDLNHWVGHLGRNPQTRTPNIDRFATTGVTFTRSYCTAPACNPSRASLMSGAAAQHDGLLSQRAELAARNQRRQAAQHRTSSKPAIASTAPARSITARPTAAAIGPTISPAESAAEDSDDKDEGVGGLKFGPLALQATRICPTTASSATASKKLKEKSDKPFFLAVGW